MLAFEVDEAGNDRTALLLHSLALDRSAFAWLRPGLAESADAIVVDLPGHGASPSPREPSIEAMADHVAETIRGAGLPAPVVAIGNSLGGCVAQALALRHPDLVEGLGLLDTTCWYGPTAAQDWEARARKAAEEGFDSLAEFQIQRWFTPAFAERHPEVGEGLLETFRRNRIEDYTAACRAMGAMDLREQVGAIKVPTVVVVGEQDPATPVSHATDLAERIDGARLEVLPECSHLSAIERPDAVLAALRELL